MFLFILIGQIEISKGLWHRSKNPLKNAPHIQDFPTFLKSKFPCRKFQILWDIFFYQGNTKIKGKGQIKAGIDIEYR